VIVIEKRDNYGKKNNALARIIGSADCYAGRIGRVAVLAGILSYQTTGKFGGARLA
jgi:hypothetical protein